MGHFTFTLGLASLLVLSQHIVETHMLLSWRVAQFVCLFIVETLIEH